jgi:uncharacterized Zn-finger protein
MEQFITPTPYQNLSFACSELITQQDENNDQPDYLYSIPTTPVVYPLSLSFPPPTTNFSAVPLINDPSGAWSDSSMSMSSDDEAGNLSPIINNGDELMTMLPGILEYQTMDAFMPTIDPSSTIPGNYNDMTSNSFVPTSQPIGTLNMPISLSSPKQQQQQLSPQDTTVAGFVNETPLSLSSTQQEPYHIDSERASSRVQDRRTSTGRKPTPKKQSRRKAASMSAGSSEAIKRFPCSTCPRSFARNHDLHRHMRVHTGDKPYVCPCCSKGFARTDALKRHFKVEETCRLSPQVLNMKSGRRHSTL